MKKPIAALTLSLTVLAMVLISAPAQKKMIQVKGSDTMVNLVQILAEEFMAKDPGTALAVVVLIGIFGLLLYTAVPAFREISIAEFLTNKTWDPTSPEKAEYGLLSMIVSTMMCTIGALVIAIPIGLGVAACLSDVAHWRVREIVKPIADVILNKYQQREL